MAIKYTRMDSELHHQLSMLTAYKRTTILEETNLAVATHLKREHAKLDKAERAGKRANG